MENNPESPKKGRRLSNLPRQALQWSCYGAEREFRIERRTLEKRLADLKIQPDSKTGFYTTLDIATAWAGGSTDLRSEKLRLAKQQADRATRENAIADGNLLDKAEWKRALEGLFLNITSIIQGHSGIGQSVKDSLLRAISDFDRVVPK